MFVSSFNSFTVTVLIAAIPPSSSVNVYSVSLGVTVISDMISHVGTPVFEV